MTKLIIPTLLALSLNATTITAQGYGKDKKDSLKESLVDLSSEISVTIKSEFSTTTSASKDSFNKKAKEVYHYTHNYQ